jgi:hypothetical protein
VVHTPEDGRQEAKRTLSREERSLKDIQPFQTYKEVLIQD